MMVAQDAAGGEATTPIKKHRGETTPHHQPSASPNTFPFEPTVHNPFVFGDHW